MPTPADMTIKMRGAFPGRPAQWRWETAVYLFQHGYPPGDVSDAAIRCAMEMMQAETGETSRRPGKKLDEARTAHGIYSDPECRGKVEARLLSRESLAESATKLALSVQQIELYRALFFDISGVDDIMRLPRVLDLYPGLQRPLVMQDYWRYAAFRYGPVALDDLLGTSGGDRCEKALKAIRYDVHRLVTGQHLTDAATMVLTQANDVLSPDFTPSSPADQFAVERAKRLATMLQATRELNIASGKGPAHLPPHGPYRNLRAAIGEPCEPSPEEDERERVLKRSIDELYRQLYLVWPGAFEPRPSEDSSESCPEDESAAPPADLNQPGPSSN